MVATTDERGTRGPKHPGLRDQDRIVPLTPIEASYAAMIGTIRHLSSGSRPLNSGYDAVRGDIVGAMGEVAVCLWYGEDYRHWVKAYTARPGAIPDIMHGDWSVSVKSTEKWERVTLFVPTHDTNQIHVLVSVDYDDQVCALRGWVSRKDLARFPPEPWRPMQPGRPTPAQIEGKTWHYVPLKELRPCTSMT